MDLIGNFLRVQFKHDNWWTIEEQIESIQSIKALHIRTRNWNVQMKWKRRNKAVELTIWT